MANKYKSLKAHKGIRADQNNNYLAEKMIDGKRYSRKFKSLRDAKFWRANYHPTICPDPKTSNPLNSNPVIANGTDNTITLGEVFEKYKELGMEDLSPVTIKRKVRAISNFIFKIKSIPLASVNAELLAHHIKNLKKDADPQRFNYDREIKELSSVFNWYIPIDQTFRNPIHKFHYSVGKIKDKKRVYKKIPLEDVVSFLDSFSESNLIYQDMAVIQYYTACRIGEVAGLILSCIDLKNRVIEIKNNLSWPKNSAPIFRNSTKTGDEKAVYINDEMFEILNRRISQLPKGCDLIFNKNGQPLRYEAIRRGYQKALDKAGVSFSGTHILRHGMATTTRGLLGLDHSQAVTGHKSIRMLEHYAENKNFELNKRSVIEVEKFLNKSRAKITTNYDLEEKENLKVVDFKG